MFRREHHEPCVDFSFVPFDVQTRKAKSQLMAALVNGAAFAFWPRHCPADLDRFQELLRNAVQRNGLDDIPANVLLARQEALNDQDHPGCALTLFWDDPDRNPLAIQTTQPETSGN
jgi:hypothetical protein